MSKRANFKCPKCNSSYVRSVDNEPLCHPTKKDVAVDDIVPIDLEIYYHCQCDDCRHEFRVIGEVTLLPIPKYVEPIKN